MHKRNSNFNSITKINSYQVLTIPHLYGRKKKGVEILIPNER